MIRVPSSKLQAPSSRGGYIALVALLVVATAGLTIGLAVSIAGIEILQISLSKTRAAQARSAALACLELDLERLRKNFVNNSATLSIGDHSCTINTVISGSTATLQAAGFADIYEQHISVQVNSALEVLVWQEE